MLQYIAFILVVSGVGLIAFFARCSFATVATGTIADP
jgi:hypothetical protein